LLQPIAYRTALDGASNFEESLMLSVNQKLVQNYTDYYEDDITLTEWRRLGGIDKCKNIIRLCDDLPHANILEIGCGDGAILERLAHLRFGSQFTGLEISPSAVHQVQEKKIPNCEVQLFDGYDLPFPEKSFDLAILSHVLEHVEYPRRLIHDAAKVAKAVFIEVPLEDNWRMSHDFIFDRVGHINFYNPRTIRSLVQSCGMTVLDAYPCHSRLPSYIFRKGKLRGTLSYWFKEIALRTTPSLSTSAMTYHYSLVYKQSDKDA
jgi:2-polyprenyl-3-methyl-5-hydroxy-6-metoxy-1,4-benzoquinol methylase